MAKIAIENMDHVSLPVSEGNLKAAMDFYGETLGLTEIPRPDALAGAMKGAWYRVEGDRTLHLIVDANSTFRKQTAENQLSSRDIHCAFRLRNFAEAVEILLEKGHRVDKNAGRWEMKVSTTSLAGFPQIFLMDPDRNVIELNAKTLTDDEIQRVDAALSAASDTGGG